MKVIWVCNICGQPITTKDAWKHRAIEHPQMVHWGTPMFVDELELPEGKKTKGGKGKKEVEEEEEEEIPEELEDLSL